MNVQETFFKLTKYTYPHGYENQLEQFLPEGFQKDTFGNYFIKIGESKSMFTCHLDTASSYFVRVKRHLQGRFIKTDGRSILGADDKAGMTILLAMIEAQVPGLYYFFKGEEVGCIGSTAVAGPSFSDYNKCVSFDRRDYNSIITHQSFARCCSEEFAIAVASELNSKNSEFKFKPDYTGIYTDSAEFVPFILECTNISVGYFNEHSYTEHQDIVFLSQLAKAVIKVDWENLPIKRELFKHNINESYDEDPFKKDKIAIRDEKNFISQVLNVRIDNIPCKVRLKNERIIKERSLIYDWLFKSPDYSSDLRGIAWDGRLCYIEYKSRPDEYLGDRDDLIYLIDELDNIPVSELEILGKN